MLRKSVLGGVALAVLALCATAPVAEAKSSNVTIVNNSDWTIVELYLAPVDTDDWGPDQLAEQVIKPGAKFVLSKIPCDSYDVRLVDEDGDECVVGGVDICAQNDTWTISSKDLLACQAESD